MKKVFSFEKYKGRNHWSEVMDLGKNSDKHEEVQNFMDAVQPEDLATIIYTSEQQAYLKA